MTLRGCRYPIPKMRALPLAMAKTIAGHAQKFKLFGSIYILTAFIITPLVTRMDDSQTRGGLTVHEIGQYS